MSEDPNKSYDIKPVISTIGAAHSFQSRGPVNIRSISTAPHNVTIPAVDPFKRKESPSEKDKPINPLRATPLKCSINEFMRGKIPPFRVERLSDHQSPPAEVKKGFLKFDDGFLRPTVNSKQRIVRISSKPLQPTPNPHILRPTITTSTAIKPYHTIMTPSLHSPVSVKMEPAIDIFPGFRNGKLDNSSLQHERIRRPCNCSKSRCLKLYCECYANGMCCENCNCVGCYNNLEYDKERNHAIQSLLARNPYAFKPKISTQTDDSMRKKGCKCARSSCLKNYCECYATGVSCSAYCACDDCRNSEFKLLRKHSVNPMDFPHLNLRAQVLKNDVAASSLIIHSHRFWNSCVFNELLSDAVIKGVRGCLLARMNCSDSEVAESDLLEEFAGCILYAKERFIEKNGRKL